MSAVSVIRTTLLPRMVVCVDEMEEVAQAVRSQTMFAIEQGRPTLVNRLTRTHLIKMHLLNERFLDDIRRIELLCEADFTLSVLVAQSQIANHRPKRIRQETWCDIVCLVNDELLGHNNFNAIFLALYWIAGAIKSRIEEALETKSVSPSLTHCFLIEEEIAKLDMQLDLICELFSALDDQVMCH